MILAWSMPFSIWRRRKASSPCQSKSQPGTSAPDAGSSPNPRYRIRGNGIRTWVYVRDLDNQLQAVGSGQLVGEVLGVVGVEPMNDPFNGSQEPNYLLGRQRDRGVLNAGKGEPADQLQDVPRKRRSGQV